MKSCLLILLTIFALVVAVAQPNRTSWPMVSGDATHTSFVKMDLSFPLQVSMTYNLGISRENGMSVSQNHLFVGSSGAPNRIVVADLHTGDTLWSFSLPGTGGGMQFVPVYADGIVMVGGQSGDGLYAFDVLTGDSLWLLPVDGLYTRGPAIDNGLVYVPSSGDGFICAEIQTGNILWSIDDFIPQICPVVSEDHVFFCSHDLVYCVDKLSGDTVWTNSVVVVDDYTSFAVDDDLLYIGYLYNITALYRNSGDVAWSLELPDSSIVSYYPGTFAMTENHLLIKYLAEIPVINQYLVLNKSTGAEVNRFDGGDHAWLSPTIINEYVVEALDGDVRFFDLLTGEMSYELTGLPMLDYPLQVIAANDRIYIAGRSPNVIALESSPSSIHSSSYSTLHASVFPNPASDLIDVLFTLYKSDAITLELVSVDGTTMMNQDLGLLSAGEHRADIDVSQLSPGVYCAFLNGMAQRGMVKIAIAPY